MALDQLKPENFLRRDSTGPNCCPSEAVVAPRCPSIGLTNRLDQRIPGSVSANWLRSRCGGLALDPHRPSIEYFLVKACLTRNDSHYSLRRAPPVAHGAWGHRSLYWEAEPTMSDPPAVSEACNERTPYWCLLDPYLTRHERSGLDCPAGGFRQSLGPADHLLRLGLTHEAQSVVRVVLAVDQALKILGHCDSTRGHGTEKRGCLAV